MYVVFDVGAANPAKSIRVNSKLAELPPRLPARVLRGMILFIDADKHLSRRQRLEIFVFDDFAYSYTIVLTTQLLFMPIRSESREYKQRRRVPD